MSEFTDGSVDTSAIKTTSPSSSGEITLEKVVEVLTKLSDMVGDATDDYCVTFKKTHGLPNTAELMQQFQGGMLQMSEA